MGLVQVGTLLVLSFGSTLDVCISLMFVLFSTCLFLFFRVRGVGGLGG